ncbi:hypothetical protein LF41_2466 [Lysobacter dokdonensis DS-58]|uniref:Uncharacterized protein n=2 Tax=Noviluteimonas TaxID=3382693 RepID=A0A0A2X3X9_9GAMM|nr:hypothetical protein LF41_2466 [Lysobacter dokdonensis DS-58]
MVVDRVTGNPVSQNGASYALDRFVSVADGWYFERPAFDHALIERDGKEFVVSIEQLKWQLVEL